MSITDPTTEALAVPYPTGERTANLGALSYLFTFKELDDAIDVLERMLSLRADRRAERAERSTYAAMTVDPDLSANRELEKAIVQLEHARLFHAIPEAALDAALAAVDEGTPAADDDADEHEPWELKR